MNSLKMSFMRCRLVLFWMIFVNVSFAQKGEQLVQAFGIEQRSEQLLKHMIELQKQTYFEELDSSSLREIESEIQNWQKLMIDSVTIIFESEFTEEEISALTEFYSTDIGQKIAKKHSVILSQSFDLEKQWALELQGKVAKEMFAKDSLYFLRDIEGCELFHEGEFTSSLNNQSYSITRKDGVHVESGNGGEYQYRINWISNCKFELMPLSNNITNTLPLDVVIYEIEGSSYKFLTKERGREFYFKGKVIKN